MATVFSPQPAKSIQMCQQLSGHAGNCIIHQDRYLIDRIAIHQLSQHDTAVGDARSYLTVISSLAANSTVTSDPHLPNCLASKNVSVYALRLAISGRNATFITNLISDLDPHQRISYWKSWRTQAIDGECAAAKLWGGPTPPRSPECVRLGITTKDIQLALHRKTQALCPGFNYTDIRRSNRECKEFIMQHV